MLVMMLALMPHAMLSGTFARAVNILKRAKFAQMHVLHLDELHHWLNEQRPVTANNVVCDPVPFSPFADQSGCCGIRLTLALISDALRVFMDSFEPHMQASFQFAADEGCSSDDSHKLTGHITVKVGKAKVKPFTAACTVMSLGGKANLGRFKFTKSNDELCDTTPVWAEARKNAGHKELLRLEGDNAAGDSAQQHSASPSLLKGVVPCEEDVSLPWFSVSPDEHCCVCTHEGLKSIALLASEHTGRQLDVVQLVVAGQQC